MNLRRLTNAPHNNGNNHDGRNGSGASAKATGFAQRKVLDEESFQRMISMERKRSERSRKPFLLMLLDTGDYLSPNKNGHVLSRILTALTASTRETDVTGWYRHNAVVGVMFTEIAPEDNRTVLSTMLTRVSKTLQDSLSLDQFNRVNISLHLFPEQYGNEMPQHPGNPALYPDLISRDQTSKLFSAVKRTMDIVGSSVALTVLFPLFLVIAAIVKLTSQGPILFRQERLGQFGRAFTFLKFRSMYVNNDPLIHKQFMKRVISGDHSGTTEDEGKTVYKMANDPRITTIGRFLRRTSLDELPQFINVLRGDMSLVGPRPPICYEYLEYDLWHRRRVLESKPGITGLWQVRGRSRVRFDDMVRLDLQYARARSLWLDVKILLETPRAVFSKDGAY